MSLFKNAITLKVPFSYVACFQMFKSKNFEHYGCDTRNANEVQVYIGK